jgi:hypothetical protein
MEQRSLTKVASESRVKAGQARPGRRRFVGRVLLLVLVLSVCLILQDRRNGDRDTPEGGGAQAVKVQMEHLAGPAEVLSGFASSPVQVFPGNVPWSTIRQTAIRRGEAIEKIIKDDPTVFLQMCLDRYERDVRGYSCTLMKWERVNGKLRPLEIVEAQFREQPFSVFMSWKKGVGKAQRVLFVQGENGDKMLAKPAGFLGVIGVVTRDLDAPDVKASGRYLINQFGINLGTVRTLNAMLKAKAHNTLHVRYEGIFRVPEAGDRLCYKIVRTPYDPLEDEGVYELTIFIDMENWLQIASILKDPAGNLIAEYFFRDVKINPQFKPNQFTRGAL